jgi:uncharacterized protein YukE
MTDATHVVTQSALEAFARTYLNGVDASIHDDGNQWHVRFPTHNDSDFSDSREFDIVLGDEATERDQDERVLTPGSDFTQQLLDDAADRATIGQLAVTTDTIDGDYQYPPWITESNVECVDASFTPYYDRTAICAFVRVGVETVSEYQTQFLEAVTLDIASKNCLSGITEKLVEQCFKPKADPLYDVTENSKGDNGQISPDELADAISVGQEAVVAEVQEEIDEIRQSASRAADSEFEEYRQLQEQRINELRNQISSLSKRLQNVTTAVDEAESQQERVDVLQKRNELQSEKEELGNKLEVIFQEKEQGYTQKQQEIYDRHAIEVNTRPIAATLITYERGEIELTVSSSSSNRTDSLRVPYAIGTGTVDEVNCNQCHERLSSGNPICMTTEGVGCRECRGQGSEKADRR